MGFVAGQGLVRSMDKVIKGNRRKLIPIAGKKMVIEDVYQHRSIMPKAGVDTAFAPQKELIAGGKGIDLPVNLYATPDASGKAIIEPPLDKIPHQVSH